MTKILAPSKFDVVGSFLRPVELKEAREKFKKGEISAQELKEVEDREIEKLVKKEKEAGLKIISDGEFRRSWWHYDFFWGLHGIEKYTLSEDELIHFHGETLRPEGVKIVGKISGKNHPFLDHYKFVKGFEDENTVAKQTVPSPAQLLRTVYKQIGAGKIYEDENKFVEDVAKAIQEDTVKYMMNVEIRQNIRRKQVLVPEEASHEDITGSSTDEEEYEGLNRAERRRLEREAKKSNVKK